MPDETTERTRRVLTEFGERFAAGDETVWEDLVAEDFVNHAAGPQGRDGFRATLAHVRRDLADVTQEEHHVLADGDHAAVHLTLRGRHVGSTMPLLAGVPVTGAEIAWTFLHLFRVEDGRLAEHWACRDDLGLLRQLGAWPPPAP
jgi:lactoylglutathione lyase